VTDRRLGSERVAGSTRNRIDAPLRGSRSHGHSAEHSSRPAAKHPEQRRTSSSVSDPRPRKPAPSALPTSRRAPLPATPLSARHAPRQHAARNGAKTTTHSGGRSPRAAVRHDVRPLQRRVVRNRGFVPGVFRAGHPRRRLVALFLLASLAFGAVLFRVTMLQTAEAGSYTAAGALQRTQDAVLRASRGVIFDRNGDELALSVPATTIFVNPKLVGDPNGTAAALATMLQLTPEKQAALAAAMSNKDKSFVYVAREIDDRTAAAVTALKLAGVDSYRESTRVIPGGDLARGVIGRTDTDGKGVAGLEQQYDSLLTGVNGELVREHDRAGRSIPGSGTVTVNAVPGKDIVLTIDRSIQFSLEQALLKRASELGARGGTAIVEETSTGNILAMASVRRDDLGVYRVTVANVGAVDSYEPGSVAKVVTIAAGLNEGVVTPESVLSVPGKIVYDSGTPWVFTITDAEPHGRQDMSVRDILVHSSNIGTIGVSEKIGIANQYAYMRAFGLGDRSGLGFPGESKGILKPWQKWRGTEQVTPAYGYGVAATAIQLVGAINTIANNGVYVTPRLVQATIGNDGKAQPVAPASTRRVVSPETAASMNLLMRQVVCDGTATKAQVDGITIAGKTGTGIKAVDGQYGTDSKTKAYYSSFVGFFPAEAPKVTTLISIDEPPAGNLDRFGGTAAAPVFQAVVPTIMHQLGIQPPTTTGGCPPK
jgi:cell division protein FtsI (penicillin-binding protein 3)